MYPKYGDAAYSHWIYSRLSVIQSIFIYLCFFLFQFAHSAQKWFYAKRLQTHLVPAQLQMHYILLLTSFLQIKPKKMHSVIFLHRLIGCCCLCCVFTNVLSFSCILSFRSVRCDCILQNHLRSWALNATSTQFWFNETTPKHSRAHTERCKEIRSIKNERLIRKSTSKTV